MINELTVADIVNDIRMSRSLFSGVFIIVEGLNDEGLYSRFIDSMACEIVIAFGKENALSIKNSLDANPVENVIYILDQDYDLLENIDCKDQSVFYTDAHDIEMVIVNSNAFEKVIYELGSRKKIEKYQASNGNIPTKEILLNKASSIGYFRWASFRHKCNYDFKDIQYGKFVDKNTLEVNIDSFLETLINHSCIHRVDKADILQKMTELQSISKDLWRICNSVDFITILGIGLRKVLGSQKQQQIPYEIISSHLRVAFEDAAFEQTVLCQSLKQWEVHNGKKIFCN